MDTTNSRYASYESLMCSLRGAVCGEGRVLLFVGIAKREDNGEMRVTRDYSWHYIFSAEVDRLLTAVWCIKLNPLDETINNFKMSILIDLATCNVNDLAIAKPHVQTLQFVIRC